MRTPAAISSLSKRQSRFFLVKHEMLSRHPMRFPVWFVLLYVLAICLLSPTVSVQAQTQTPLVITPITLTLTNVSTPYTQNFNTDEATPPGPGLANGNNDTLSATLPVGWGFVETGVNANATYRVHTGSSSAVNDTYSFGATSSATDRAFGEITGAVTTSLQSLLGAQFTNGTGSIIDSVTISYVGEQWHRDTATGDRLDFKYSTNTSVGALTGGTFTDFNSLDFTQLVTGSSAGLDGNNATNRTAFSNITISGLNIQPGGTFTIRWDSIDPTGGDAGLSIDDFSMIITAVPEPSTWAGAVLAVGVIGYQLFGRRKTPARSEIET